MKPTLILHAGFPKTGSSSIQMFLATTGLPGHRFLDLDGRNHGDALAVLFGDRPGGPRKRVLRESLFRQIDEADEPNVIISAERMGNGPLKELQALRDAVAEHVERIKVIAYVRPIGSMLASLFQQRSKSGLFTQFPGKVDYEASIGALDSVFGAENVTLRKFQRDEFVDGDVVADFAAQLGHRIDVPDSVETNTAAPAETVALRYFNTKLAASRRRNADRRKTEQWVNNRLNRVLARIGDTKFAFSQSLIEDFIRENERQVSWAEERMGVTLRDNPEPKGPSFGSEAEFEAFAVSKLPELDRAFEDFARKMKLRDRRRDKLRAEWDQAGSDIERAAAMIDSMKTELRARTRGQKGRNENVEKAQ